MNNNTAIVAKLGNIRPIEGKDKIVSAQVILNGVPLTQVVVGIDTKEDTPIVYFDSNLSLPDIVIDKIDKLSPDYGKEDFKGLRTYLAKGNRIRAIKLGSTLSNGLAIEIEKFYQFFNSIDEAKEFLVHGNSFTHIKELEICKKWLPPVKGTNSRTKEKKGNKKISRVIPELFHFHIDTQQLLRNLHMINPNQIISISRKVHGTSAIVSNAKVLRKLSPFDKVLKFFKYPINEMEYDYLYASRTVIKNDAEGTGFYGVDLWTQVGKDNFLGKLHKGESVYYEIVGYIPATNKYIQKGYDYGCKVGEYKIAVYRITQTNDDGIVFEYGWEAVKERCKELNTPMVQEYYFGKAKDLYPDLAIDENWNVNFAENLKRDYLEKDCNDNFGKKVPDEGIVLRIEAKDITVYKLKSEKFFVHESKMKEKEDNIDIEEEEEANKEDV